MRDDPHAKPESELLPQQVMERLLTRASELDAARRMGTAVEQLRAAASEAGISPQAFDAALAELRAEQEARVPAPAAPPPRPARRWGLAAALAFVILTGAVIVPRMVLRARPPAAATPLVEEAILLRCLTPGEAAELVRPLLRRPDNMVVHNPTRAPRVLTIRVTPEQLQEVRALLGPYEGDGSSACPVRPAPPGAK